MGYQIIDSCPCPERLYPVLVALKQDTGCTFESIYRGEDAAGLLHANGKHTQGELYQMYLNGQGNPANPPGHSTHELRDGPGDYPYGSPDGSGLAYWQVGIDINDSEVDGVIAAAQKRGWQLWRPYDSGSEYHHVNFRSEPKLPPADPNHYQWFPTSIPIIGRIFNERKTVENYDKWRAAQTATQHPYRAQLTTCRAHLKLLSARVWVVAHFSKPPKWDDGRRLGYRFQQLFKRSKGQRVNVDFKP